MSQKDSKDTAKPIIHHIPLCPFCQRIEVLVDLKGVRDQVEFAFVDAVAPREQKILDITGGTTALPVLELGDGVGLKESLVLMDYIEERFPDKRIRRTDPYEYGLESLLVSMASPFVGNGYRLLMNTDPEKRDGIIERYFKAAADIDAFLRQYGSKETPWLFEEFGWAESAFASFFKRFEMIPYYEHIDIPEDGSYDRFLQWRKASLEHPAVQHYSFEEIAKAYYDYTQGAMNGQLVEGRKVSSFAQEPDWRSRPMPPREKYGTPATDEELGLV